MADSVVADIVNRPPFTSKAALIAAIWEQAGPNCPSIADLLIRIAYTDLAGSLTGGATVTPTSYGL